MSADSELDAPSVDALPATGIRSRSQFARRIHRQNSQTDESLPACGERHRDTDYKECAPSRLLGFQRWTLCDNAECFGESDDGDDDDLPQPGEVITGP